MKTKNFKDTKNLLNYHTFEKLQKAAKDNKKIFLKRIVNGNTYLYKTVIQKDLCIIVIKNLSKFRSIDLIISKDFFENYNNLIAKISA